MAKKEEEADIREGSSYDLAVDPPLEFKEGDDFSSNSCPRLVVNGLKLKYKSQDQKIPYKSFSYTPAIEYNNDLAPTDWQFLSADNVERDHIRIHELRRDGDDLLKCAKEYQENHAKAMIVINTSEDYTLSPELSQPLQKFESFFVAILPHTDGTALLDCLHSKGDHEIFARLDVVSSEPEPFTIIGEDEHTVVSKATAEMESNIQPQARIKTKGFKLKREILKVMFDDDRMRRISMDEDRFIILMSTFTQYEKMGKPNSSKVNKLIKRFNHYLEPSFQFEFPFFLILIYKFRKFQKYYECDELVPFIKRCIIMLDGLTPSEVSGILNLFSERKDFDVMFGQEETNTSVFTVLADACKSLMSVSIRLKKNHSLRGILYSKLMWISIHLKFVEKKRGPKLNWNLDFVETSREIQVKNDVINDLKLGLEVSNLLNLPLEYQFTTCHLARFLADENFIRPLSHVRDVIIGLETFIKNDEDLLAHLMTSLQIHYTELLKFSNKTFIKQASVKNTVQGTLNEGISFLDSMSELWCNKKWNEGDMHVQFRDECLNWMMLLLQAVHITDASTPKLLNTFLVPEKGSMMADEYFQSHIANGILEVTTKCFPALTIQVFFPLHEAHAIWPISFLHEYLKQYPIPDTIRINDAIWSKFFTTILERFQGDEPQNHVVDFLIRVAYIYTNNRRASIFILDLLQLKVTHLFSSDADGGLDGKRGNFSHFLRGYIQQNNIRPELMRRIQDIFGYIENEQTAFQCIILNVLKHELIPDLTLLQIDVQFKDLLKQVVKILRHKVLEFKSPKLKFCWSIVTAVCCKMLTTTRSFQWVCSIQDIIKEVGVVFNTYCDSHMLSNQQCLLTEALPVEIEHCPWDDVRQYFKWVQLVQDILHHWQNKFQRNDVNYDEMMMYANNIKAINALSQAVCAAAYVLDEKYISTKKETFIHIFEQLNCYLLWYVPDHPEVKYCTLPELLLFYGVSFPPVLQETLQQRIIFPGNENRLLRERVVSLTSTEGSNQKLSLMVTGSFSLLNICILLEDLKSFLEPIADQMEMLVFFHLHKSEIFKKHLLKHLEDIMTASSTAKEPQMTFMNFPFSIKPSLAITKQGTKQANDKGIPITVLKQALDKVKDLLVKVIEGTATYSDIVAGGAFNLETLNTEDEFTTLTKSFDLLEVNRDNCKGLDGVKCMLELFQFTSHIVQIEQVCEQYGLDLQCLKDEKLRKMLSMVEELKPEKSRDILTPIEAKEKMAFINEALCLDHCMDLFPAVADSVAFYQFIKDKMFVGPKGQAIFCEQYQLITAHLQHEEYDENVLNHLGPAYQFIAPFMEANITLCKLMSEVIKLDTTNRLKQLKTVNENITLIRLWFSRAEGDTIENVAKELQDILSTGVFQFQLSGSSSILLIYKYQAMQSMPTETSRVSNSDLIAGPESCQEHILEDSSNGAKEEEDALLLSKDRSVERKWTSEQIADFVIKLGFKEKGGDKIQQFLHLNSTANKLFELCTKLFKLGHPHYQKDTDLPVLSCNTPAAEADAMVNSIQQTLIKWQNQSATLHQEYIWLLFFSVPKALHLYLLLERYRENPELHLELHLDSIVLEVSVMFENKQSVRTKLKSVVQDAIKKTQKNMKGAIPGEFLQSHKEMDEAIPMKFLGEFLHQICKSEELQTFLCKKRSTCCIGSTSQILSETKSGSLVGSMYQLHYTPGYSLSQLICLITELYNGVPECYEVFHCKPSTTQEELHLFSERIKHHPLTYLVLQVNKLPFSLQELLISLLKHGETPDGPQNKNKSSVHFIETSPSVLREVPWINYQEHESDGPTLSLVEAGGQCRQVIFYLADFTDIQLVYGHAGDGKTHYIRQQLAKSPAGLTVAINEAFTPLYAINHLNTLPHNVTGCAVFFNFTIMPYQEIQDETEKRKANELMETIGWFFYHFMILGYIEDPTTGASFRFPGGQEWTVYIEVPSLDRSHRPEESLQLFTKKFPTLHLLGSKHLMIDPATPITVDEDVQLVCKYLRAYKIGGDKGIDRLYQDRNRRIFFFFERNVPSPIVKFSADPDLSDDECHQLLMEYMPDHVQETKITQKLFIRYMKKRCAFLDTLPAFNFNSGSGEILTDKSSGQKTMTDTSQLGSTLVQTMIEEARNFCDPDMKGNWAEKSHQQLIYDFRDGGGSFGLLSLQPENMPEDRRKEYERIGFELHAAGELRRREILDQMLARALGLPSEAGKRLSIIDDCNYVLTPDYALKMLNIHERYSCGMPVVIKGETGVGKTALVEMLSQLWNNALLYQWYKEKGDIINTIHSKIVSIKEVLESYQTCLEIVKTIAARKTMSAQDLKILRQLDDKDPTKLLFTSGLMKLIPHIERNPAEITAPLETTFTLLQEVLEDSLKSYQTCLEIMESVTGEREVSVDELMILGQLNDRDPTKGFLASHLRDLLLDMEKNPAVALLEVPSAVKGQNLSLAAVFESTREHDTIETTATLLQAVLKAEIRNTFHKLNVHTALSPGDIKTFFEPIINQADILKEAYVKADKSKKAKIKMPFITVFLDEVNTSSCLGLFKEIIVDKTLDGKVIPENIFIVAACNPHRGNSMATHETWLRSSYYVRPLHPTLEYLMWDYGSLNKYQERDYILAKMQMLHKELPSINAINLIDPIIKSQILMREYAWRQLTKQKMRPKEAEVSSKSCVSQRDIQRVFRFYQWIMSVYNKLNRHGSDRKQRAVMVSLGIVYYMRLNSEYRKKYEEELNRIVEREWSRGSVLFFEAFNDELDYFCESIKLPLGIAKTQALKENLFAAIVCTMTHTPLVIVGPPGSSKTLSTNLTIANLKGPESRVVLFQDTEIFKSLDPHFYQCSHRTTSNEIQTVFSHAINRQRSHAKFSLPIYCVVFMDEAGLPEESHESLKVLHYHLDKQEVSFVAITNHVLDAAKTNRAVCLFRPEVSNQDLETLAKGCLTADPENPPTHLKQDLETIVQFCPAYTWLMKDPKLRHFFGQRDFIHFINYLRKRRAKGITPQLVIEALERNFNGVCWSDNDKIFQTICKSFLKNMAPPGPIASYLRSILEVLKESLDDHPEESRIDSEVRYKLVIDPTEDNSLMHLLIAFGVLDRKKTRIYVCSDFSGDSQIQKINVISAIRHSVFQGHTVVMSQTDDIHESFYDLFNQRFRKIDDPDPERSPRYYTNIAIGAHIKPCRVHPDFSCVVVVKQTEVDTTPAPFLNRFEKYFISHETLLNSTLNHLNPCVRIILQTAKEKVKEFINVIGGDSISFYGLKPQTLDSLLLSLLPPYGHTYKETPPAEKPVSSDVRVCLLHELLRALRNSAGFAVPAYSTDELVMDATHLFPLLSNDAMFVGVFDFLTIETANVAVNEALHVLHTAPSPNEEGVVTTQMSQEACLVVSILQQWLIRHLCKTLMQLMTPEAICLHRKKIPASLIENYLTNQQHFSLKKLIKHHLLALEYRQSSAILHPNKLLCFTRSSSIIHHLPTTYPHPAALKKHLLDEEDVIYLKELIHDDPTHVQVCQVLSVQSQSVIQETLRCFIQESTRRILLLMVNMQEATAKIVNHLRIMIEEVEVQAPPTSNKLFVLLLHFPPAMFFDPCYPSLFLREWNHYYLDSIGHSSALYSGKLDIEEWFQRCCFSDKEFIGDNLLEACNHLLTEVVPVLIARVTYGTRSTGPFTKDMTAGERSEKLKELLFKKKVGQKLCQMFRACWHPNVMTECLEQAARFTQSRESSLNISDALQSKFQSLFFDFMVVMVTTINTEQNLDVLFSQDNCSEMEELFLLLLETINPPKLDQTKTLARSLAQPKPQEYQPRFPFFSMVCKRMKELIEDYRKVQNQKDNMLEEHPEEDIPTYSEGMNSRIKDLADLVLTTIDNHFQEGEVPLSDPLFITLKCVRDHPDQLCDRYFSDFIYHFFHLDIVAPPLSREFIHTFFSEFLQLPPLERLVNLHIYVDYDRINLANACSLFRPLEKIWEIAASSPQTLATEGSSPANDFIKVVSETKHPFGDPQKLSSFVISALFSALVGTKDEGINNGTLKMWYRTYQSVMSMPALTSHLYMTSLPDTEEAKFNTMHTTFALMHVYPVLNKDVLMKGNKLFTKLLQTYFKANLQLKDSEVVPSLNDCSEIAGQLIVDDGNAQNFTQTLQEELFNHFLSPYKASYSSQDRDWFLRHANCQGTLKTSVYKRYLSLLLWCHSKNEDQNRYDFDAVEMYDPGARQNVAKVLLKDGEEPGPYIPTFYQDCRAITVSESSENLLMQQPLCHLYFATLMEHLMAEPHGINSLVQLAGTISQCSILESVPVGDKIVLQIEKQAVIQSLLRELASLYSKSTNQVQELAPIMDDLNGLLNDDITVGGAIRGYGLTLGMHILHKLQSHRQFTVLFTTKYRFIREIQCTNFFHEMLSHEAQVESSPYFLPFMYDEDQASTLGKLYQQVKSAMLSIHEGSQASVDQLLKVDDECVSYENRPQAFKMILWLVTYYEFFAKEKSLHVLSTMIEQQMKCCRNDKGFVQLIKSFLTQGSLIEKKESSLMPQRDNTQILPDDDNADPLYDLFNPSSPKDQSDPDLCHCLANLVGVVLGCQPRSNHLWYHLFSPDELKDTYMTGFMYDDKISPEGLLYDCGVELTPDGQYGRLDYLPHATRGTYSLHSLYFLLWANFGTLCVSMLTQPNSQSNIHGVLISDQRAIRHYCVSQVKSLWMNLRNNLSLSDEERSFLLTRCLLNMYETKMESAGISLGMLKTKEERDACETFWHENVFTPAWKELHDKFKGLCQNQIFTNIHQLGTCYPQYPSEWDFLNYIQGLKVGNDWRLLTRFVVEKQRLEVGGQLLPILIQLYQWLHTSLAHLVTPERASNKLMIGEVIELAARKVNPSLKELYQNVKGLYNKYVKLVGGAIGKEVCTAVRRGNRICTIQDDIPLIHFLSGSEEDNGNDWLYAVIRDIAEAQNHFIHTLYTNVGDVETGEHHLAHLLPQDHSYIYPHEANEHSCIVPKQKIHHGLTEYLQLVRARLDACGQAKAALSHPSLSFNLTRLQEDIVSHYLSGKPIIQDVSSLRTVFKFKQEPDSDPMGTTFDITVLRNNLPQEYRVPLVAHQSRSLECEFHSANYHVLTDIVIGLQTAVGFLMKVLTPDNSTSDQSLHTTILNDFIVSQYKVEKSEQCQVLSQIGIKNISGTQLRCLSSIKLPLLFSTLELFVEWVKEGLYDFSSLPMALKVHLTKDDLANLEQIPVDYPGTSANLLTELKGLAEVLLHREPYIVKEINEIARKPLMEVLDTLGLDLGQLPNLIPLTVLVHHYVKFRMILRKLILITEQSVTMETSFQDINQKQWSETVDDLWSKALPHLRDKSFAFIDPNLLMSTTYGFYGDNWEEEEEETENELGGELNKDTSADESSHELPKISGKKKIDIEQEAKKWSLQNISQFLEKCGKKEHVETFLDEGIDGPQLLNAARDVYRDLGVTSSIGYAQIAVLFKRELMGVETIHCSVSDLIKSSERLARHEKTLQEAGVDGDMLKFAQQNDFLAELLQDIGIPKPLDRNRFDTALKDVPEPAVISPDEDLQDQGYKPYSTTV